MLLRGVGDECSEPSGGKACSPAAKVDRRLRKQATAAASILFAAHLPPQATGQFDDAWSRRHAKSNRGVRIRQHSALVRLADLRQYYRRRFQRAFAIFRVFLENPQQGQNRTLYRLNAAKCRITQRGQRFVK